MEGVMRFLVGLLIVGALLVATNPSRVDFNAWAQTYAVRKIEEEARKNGQEPNSNIANWGGAFAGALVAHMPIERRNLLVASIYEFPMPKENSDEEGVCRVIGIAGQFLPVGDCP
jgi:hypothetical protein